MCKKIAFPALLVFIIIISGCIDKTNIRDDVQNTSTQFFCSADSDCRFNDWGSCITIKGAYNDPENPCGNACMTRSFLNDVGKSCKCIQKSCKESFDNEAACQKLCDIAKKEGCHYGSYGRKNEVLEGLSKFNCSQLSKAYNCCESLLPDTAQLDINSSLAFCTNLSTIIDRIPCYRYISLQIAKNDPLSAINICQTMEGADKTWETSQCLENNALHYRNKMFCEYIIPRNNEQEYPLDDDAFAARLKGGCIYKTSLMDAVDTHDFSYCASLSDGSLKEQCEYMLSTYNTTTGIDYFNVSLD